MNVLITTRLILLLLLIIPSIALAGSYDRDSHATRPQRYDKPDRPAGYIPPRHDDDSSLYLRRSGEDNIIGTVGKDSIFIHDYGDGTASGNIGDKSVWCHENVSGTLICN